MPNDLPDSVKKFLASLPKSREPYVIRLADRTVYIWVCDLDEPCPADEYFASKGFSEPHIVTKQVERE